MNAQSLAKAVETAERFLKAAKAVTTPEYTSKENGTVKRASMDLSRALSEMRKSG